MKLTEIKNDLATINYSPELNKLLLSDFILIEDTNQSILTQVISIEATIEDDVNSAMLKFLLSIDKDANLTQYTGYVPSKNASLILINPEEVVQLIKGNDKNLYLGSLASYPDIPIELSLDFLRKRPYIQVDYVENRLNIVENIVKGLEKHNRKTLLFDFLGLYSGISLPTVTLGYNFKLPLNYEALCYIAEEELNDCDNENKAIIQGILIEVQNYVKTAPEGYIPFDTLISVLDSQYNENQMPELLLLKNKLLKYQQQGLFAQKKSEFDFLDAFLKDAKNFKFDLSELPAQWHRIAFVTILNLIKAKCYLITDFSDENSNKTIIKKLYDKPEIKPIVLSSYNYKYQLQLKALSKNLILFKPTQKVNDFAGYTSFLNILSHDTYIIWGEQTLFIPLILKLQPQFKQEIKISKKSKDVEKITSEKATEDSVIEETVVEEYINEKNTENIYDDEIENITTESPIGEPIEEPIEDYNILDNIENTTNEENFIDDFKENDDTLKTTQQNKAESSLEIVVNADTTFDGDFSEFDIIEEFAEPQENTVESSESTEFSQPEEKTTPTQNQIDDSAAEATIIPEKTEHNENINDLPNADDLDFFFEDENSNESVNEEISDFTENSTDNDFTSEFESEETIDTQNEQEILDKINAQIAEDFEEDEIQEEEVQEDKARETEATEEIDEDETLSDETEVVEDFENIELDENLQNIEQTDTQETDNEIENSKKVKDTEDTPQKEIVEPLPETPSVEIKSPSVPIYKSEVAPEFDTKFAKGTYVHSPKYGRGIVEDIVNYGNRTLLAIIFDADGRKVLDPTLNELKQV